MKKKMRLTRALVAKLPESIKDPGIQVEEAEMLTPNYHANTADAVLAGLPGVGELWVFAFGSLIWKPRFEHCEQRAARVNGWRRSFCIGPDQR